MYLKLKNKKLKVLEYTKFKDRFKTLKFYLYDFDFGIKLPKKKLANTYLFCKKVDICFTDKEDKILYLYSDIRSEKLIFKFKAKNVYFFPVGTNKFLKKGEYIKLLKK